jgi:hypothetical protein
MRYVKAFNGKTLHDGTNRWSVSRLPITLAARIEKVEMANGAWFDPNYGEDAVAQPMPFDAMFLFRFAAKAAAEAEEAAIKALIKTNGTATAGLTSGGADQTCNASLRAITLTHYKNDFSFKAVFHFEPFTDWS